MFKRTILAAAAISMLAVPMAHAQNRYDPPRQGHQYSQPNANQGYKAPGKQQAQKPAPKRQQWTKGQRVPDWQRKQHVRDYQRHGLKRPAKGQQWVKVDNNYLLISLATGVILGLTAAR